MARVDLWAECNAAREAITPGDREMLTSHGISASDVLMLCGVAQIRRDRTKQLFEPHDGGALAFVSPVMIEWPDTPEANVPAQSVRFGELVDMVAWHPAHPETHALRVGAAEWLGAIPPQYLEPEPVAIHKGVLGWLQARATGLVLLGHDSASRWRVLSACGSVQARDQEHAAELRKQIRLPLPVPRVCVA